MTTSTALLCLALVAAAGAASWEGSNNPRCSTECSIAAPKLFYIPNKTYVYAYNGKSSVELKGVEGGMAESTWLNKVALTWLTPCDVAITITEARENMEGIDLLKKYPLVAAVSDGRVQHVCSHPDDEPWAINIKKGIASAFQNSLPSFNTSRSFNNLTETDVVGRCPTQYRVEGEGNQAVVTKEKNHRFCNERHYTPSETQLPWLKAPLPVQESWSKCTQVVNIGIFKSITCEDVNVIKPMYGSYKYVKGKQESTMRYETTTNTHPSAIAKLSGVTLDKRSLVYDYHRNEPKNNQTLVAQLEQVLTLVCKSTKDVVKHDAATLMANAVRLMRRVPHQTLPQILQKLRSKQFCPDNKKMESIFLDSIAFAHEAGSVKIMVDEIVNGRVSGGRTALYTAAFYLLPRPCIHVVDALKPLFESDRPPAPTKLAAASIVNLYCRHKPQCNEEAPVQGIIQAVANKIRSQCSSSSTTPELAQTDLKVLANIGVISPEAASAVITCMETETPNINVQVAAAQAFRLARCQSATTERLINFALNPAKNTEVRISAYLAAVRCAEQKDLERIVETISSQLNTQVRGFILSHLLNLQQSDAPEKQLLRYNLTNIVIPKDFEADMRRYSRNIDLSYWVPWLGVGAGLESNVIYAPGSFMPSSLDLNLTTALGGTPLNIAELGARMQGLEPVIAKAFGPDGYFRKSSYEKILQDAAKFIQKNWQKIQQEFENLRHRRSVDYSLISTFLNNIYGDQPMPAQADFFARFMGQELAFVSLAGDLKQFDVATFIKDLLENVWEKLPSLNNMTMDTGRVAHINLDYDLPTIQGTPLKLKLKTTLVAGLKVQSNIPSLFSEWPHGQNRMIIEPSFSLQTDGFIGYDASIKRTGLKTNNTICSANDVSILVSSSSDNDLQVELDIPGDMDLILVESDTYLMIHHRGEPETRIIPSSMRDVRITKKDCIKKFEHPFGLRLCYDLDVPNVIHSNSLPLVSRPVSAKIRLVKTVPDMRGYKVALAVQHEATGKKFSGKFSTKGSSTPKEVDVAAEYKTEQDQYTAAVKLQSSVLTAKLEGRILNQDSQKVIETYTELRTGDMLLAKAAKIDFRRSSSSGYGREYDLKVLETNSQQFSPQSVILETKYKQSDKDPKLELEVMAATKNALREYIPFDYQLEGDVKFMTSHHIPVPTKLKKMEFHVGAGGWKINSFVRQTEESGERVKYSSSFKISCGTQDFVSVQATQDIEGEPGQTWVASSSATGKVGRAEYKANYKVELTRSKKTVSMQILRSSDSKKILDLNTVFLVSQPFTVQFMVESQVVADGMKFEAKAAEHSPEKYEVKMALSRGSQDLILIQGPVTAIIMPQVTQIQTDLTINNDKRLTTKLISQHNKLEAAIRLEKNQLSLLIVEWNTESESSRGATVSAKMLVQGMFDTSMDLVLKPSVLHASGNMLLLPNTDMARRIKAFTDLNLDSQQWQADLAWDADRDRNKKVSVQAQVISFSRRPLQASVQSEVVWIGQNYGMKMNLKPGSLITPSEGPSIFQVEVTTPTHQTHSLHTQINFQQQPIQIRVESHGTYKNSASKEYVVTNRINWEKATGSYGFKMDSQLEYTPPEGQKKSFTIQASHQSSAQQRAIEFKATAKTPSLSKPLETEMRMTNEEYSYKIKVDADVSRPATMFNWHLETFPEGGVKTFDTAIDASAIRDLLQAVSQLTGFEVTGINVVTGNRLKVFQSRYHRPDASTHTVLIRTPAQSVEGTVKYSPTEVSFELYPNRHEGEAKYEVSARSSFSYMGSSHEARVSHPDLSKDIMARIELASYGTSQQGSFELDIFPDTADKVTGIIQSTATANNTVRIEVDLQARIFRVSHRMSLEASWSPRTKAFGFRFHKTPATPSSVTVAVKHDQITAREASLSALVMNYERKVVDFAGVVTRELLPHCNGLKLNATIRTSVIGDFDILSEMCKPAFVKLITKRSQANHIYISKLGIQLPHTAELSITEADRFGFNKRPISMLGMELASPTRLKMKIGGNTEEPRIIKEFVQLEAERVIQSLKFWAREVYQQLEEEAQQKGIPFPSPELVKVMSEINRVLTQIKNEVEDEVVRPWREAINCFFQSPSATEIKRVVLWVWSGFIRTRDAYTISIQRVIEGWMHEFSDIKSFLTQAVTQAAQWVQTGHRSELLDRLWRELKESSLVETMDEALVEPMRSKYPKEYRAALQVLRQFEDEFIRDMEKIRQYLINIPVTKTITTSIINTVTDEGELTRQLARNITSQLMKMGVGMEATDHMLTLIVPLYRPLYSLTQVLKEMVMEPLKMAMGAIPGDIPYTSLTDTYFTWMPSRQMLPPFNATAIVVNGTEIFTFDGAALRAPATTCKILLTSIPEVADIHMSHPQSASTPEVTFQAGHVLASISPDFTVKLNGQPVNVERTVPPVTVWVTPRDVKVMSPLLGLHMLKDERVMMVDVSGWAFNHTRGLLGSYDGEKANDWLLRDGRNASSLQELVKSWQDQSSCPTPDIGPINLDRVAMKHYIQCRLLFFLKKGCKPLVNPEPFLAECYQSDNACTSVRAYQEVCAAQGYVSPVPGLCFMN